MAERVTGVVKWFDAKKGYGFIQAEDGQEVFIHYSEIQGQDFKTLDEAQKVEFEIGQGKKGPVAQNLNIAE